MCHDAHAVLPFVRLEKPLVQISLFKEKLC